MTDAEDTWARPGNRRAGVVKPQDGNQAKAFRSISAPGKKSWRPTRPPVRRFRDDILVERYLPATFRFLVIGDKLIAAPGARPPQVIGDGEHTVRQLVEIVNADPPRRRPRRLR